MKKRTIIAILVTILTIIFTNHYWLIFKPMPVDLDVKGTGNCNIEVELNKKDNDTFKKVKADSKLVDLNKISHISFSVKKSRHPKRVRFVFTNFENKTQITISNINLKHNKYKITDLNKIDVSGARIITQNNSELTFIPNYPEVILTYPDTLNIFTSIHFDIKVLIIILVITYLFAYKLSNYIADFKTIQGKSRIDIIFLTIFFVLLFIPMLHIDNSEISEKENRFLAKWQPLINQDGEINFDFGKNFSDWFNDRFNFRYHYVQSYNKFISTFSDVVETQKCILNKKTNFMLWKNIMCYTPDEISTISKNLNNFAIFCTQNNIKLYVLLIPTTNYIYYEQSATYITSDSVKNLNTQVNIIKQNSHFSFIYPYKELKQASENDYVYFKTDHHWTDVGAFIGYQLLMNEINKDFPNIKITKPEDYNITYSKKVRSDWDKKFFNGHTMEKFFPEYEKRAESFLDVNYKYYEHKDKDLLQQTIIDIPYKKQKNFYYPKGNNLRVLQMGTSMNENLTQFTPYTFKNLKYIRLNNVKDRPNKESFKIMKYYKKEILDYKPDILILCITPGNLPCIQDIFNEE